MLMPLKLGMVAIAALTAFSPAASTGTQPTTPTIALCDGTSVVKPKTIVFACGDGNLAATSLEWSSWTQKMAVASGQRVENTVNDNGTRITIVSPTRVTLRKQKDGKYHLAEMFSDYPKEYGDYSDQWALPILIDEYIPPVD